MLAQFFNRKDLLKLIGPIVKIISKTGVNPNYITASSIIFALITAYLLVVGDLILAALFIIIAILIDNIDGAVAKSIGRVTKFGNYFDAMVDRYVEVIIYLGFSFGGYPTEAILAVTGSLLVSYAKSRVAIVVPIDNHDWPAIGERADRLLILIIGTVLGSMFINFYNYSIISITLYLIALVSYIGSFQRVLYGKELIMTGGKK